MLGTAQQGEGLGTFAVADVAELGGDLVHRLLPRDLLPASIAPPADPLQHMVHPVRVVVQFEAGRRLDAQLAGGGGVLEVADEPDRPVVLHLDEHPAASRAEPA